MMIRRSSTKPFPIWLTASSIRKFAEILVVAVMPTAIKGFAAQNLKIFNQALQKIISKIPGRIYFADFFRHLSSDHQIHHIISPSGKFSKAGCFWFRGALFKEARLLPLEGI